MTPERKANTIRGHFEYTICEGEQDSKLDLDKEDRLHVTRTHS